MTERESDPTQPRVIKRDDTEVFDRGSFQGYTYIPKEANIGVNALGVVVNGRHPRKRVDEGNLRTYFVIAGKGRFDLDDATEEVNAGDMVVIPEGCEYSYEGDMSLFEVNVSPDNSFGDTKLE